MPFMPETWPNEATHYATSRITNILFAHVREADGLWYRWRWDAELAGRWRRDHCWIGFSDRAQEEHFFPLIQIPGRNAGLRVPPAQCGVTGQLEKGTTMPVMTGAAPRRVDRNSALTLTRADVKPGQVFVVKNARTGAWGNTKYACLDSNGRLYSLKITPEGDMNLAATDNGASEVKIVGKWRLNAVVYKNGDRKLTTRGAVKDGQLFAVKGGKKTYAHVGTLNDGRAFSMVLNSDNHGVTRNMRSKVTIVGEYTIDVQIV